MSLPGEEWNADCSVDRPLADDCVVEERDSECRLQVRTRVHVDGLSVDDGEGVELWWRGRDIPRQSGSSSLSVAEIA